MPTVAELNGGIAVEGLTELKRTFKFAPKDVRLAFNKEVRTVAEPTRLRASRLAVTKIRRMRFSPKWAKYRVGFTGAGVYVAPNQRGVKTKGRQDLRRPNLGTLLAQRASQPALQQTEQHIEREFSDMLDRLTTKWNSDGKRTVA